jgi:hypothetical protein
LLPALPFYYLIKVLNALLAVELFLSLTVMVKVKVPMVVGVPLMSPVLLFNASPPGNAPDVTCQRSCTTPLARPLTLESFISEGRIYSPLAAKPVSIIATFLLELGPGLLSQRRLKTESYLTYFAPETFFTSSRIVSSAGLSVGSLPTYMKRMRPSLSTMKIEG